MIESTDAYSLFCNTVALIYHESRNVRHLSHAGLLDPEPLRFVVSLPTDRNDAWRQIAPLRDKARQPVSVDGALNVFESKFQVSLADLLEMFGNENWRHAR